MLKTVFLRFVSTALRFLSCSVNHCSIIFPSNKRIVLWAICASCSLCVTITIAVPSWLSSVSRRITSAPFLESRLPVGSSASISLGPKPRRGLLPLSAADRPRADAESALHGELCPCASSPPAPSAFFQPCLLSDMSEAVLCFPPR